MRTFAKRALIALAALAALFAQTMLFTYPRQYLLGQTIHGKPICAWEAAGRRFAHRDDAQQTWLATARRFLGVEPKEIMVGEFFTDAAFVPVHLTLIQDEDVVVRRKTLLCVWIFGTLDDAAFEPVLRRRLNDTDNDSRLFVEKLLERIELKSGRRWP
jgi:hypothetical protein